MTTTQEEKIQVKALQVAAQRAKSSGALKLAAFLDAWRTGNQAAMLTHASLNWQRFNLEQGFDVQEALQRVTGGRQLLAYKFDSAKGEPSATGLINAWDFPVTLAFQKGGLKVFEFPVVQVVCCSSKGGFSDNPLRHGIWGVSAPTLRPTPKGLPQSAASRRGPRHLTSITPKAKGLV